MLLATSPLWLPLAALVLYILLGSLQALDAYLTLRRIREAVLVTDGGWLADVDAEIAALRTLFR
jgi:hypothetical protein